jgi:hypothetical protein
VKRLPFRVAECFPFPRYYVGAAESGKSAFFPVFFRRGKQAEN